MAQLVKNYTFGLPLNTIEELNNIERNLFTDDKYAASLVNKIHFIRIYRKTSTNYCPPIFRSVIWNHTKDRFLKISQNCSRTILSNNAIGMAPIIRPRWSRGSSFVQFCSVNSIRFVLFLSCSYLTESILFSTEVYKDEEKTEEQYHQSIQKAIQMSRNRITKLKMKQRKQTGSVDKSAVKYFYYDWNAWNYSRKLRIVNNLIRWWWNSHGMFLLLFLFC